MKAKKLLAVVITAVMLVSMFAMDSFAENKISKQPSTLVYEVGKKFTPTGIEVKVGSSTKKYATASHKPNFRFEPDVVNNPLTKDDTAIDVYYEDDLCGTVQLTLLELTGKTLEKSFVVGEEFDPTGIEVSVYTSSETKKVTPASGDSNLTITPAAGATLSSGNTTATVKYKVGTKTITFTDKVPISINQLNDLPAGFKKEYTVGEKFNPVGLSVTYNGEVVEYPNADFSFEPSLDTPFKIDDTAVEVSFKGDSYGWIEGITVKGLICGPDAEVGVEGKSLDPTGLKTYFNGEEISYESDPDNFSFYPSISGILEISDEPIAYEVSYKGYFVGDFEITVDHNYGPIQQLESGKEHARFCKTCGYMDPDSYDFCENHAAFKPNDDAGLFKLQTETGLCTVCNSHVTRSIEGSNKFYNIFDFVHDDGMGSTETMILEYFQMIIVSLIQMIIPV